MPYGLLSTGFVPKPLTVIKSDLAAAYKAVYGVSIGSEPDGSIPANTAIGQILPKARFEDWSLGDATNFLRVGPVIADRMDSLAQPMELEPGEDPVSGPQLGRLDGCRDS